MPSSHTLFACDEFAVGEFHCLPEDPAWSQENSVGPGRHVVFPGTGVLISQDGRDPVVADPNHVVLYEDHQTYRRELVSARGDHCVFVIPSPAFLRQLCGGLDAEVRFTSSSAPADGRAYLLQHEAVRYLHDAEEPDPDVVRESFYEALRRVVDQVLPPVRVRRAGTERDHREAVEAAKSYLAVHATERVLLDDVAAHVHLSPFHLSRIFKERTGSTLHAYLNQLRLRAALLRLDGGEDLSTVALDHGFASHAHFTGSFTAGFCVTPSQVRGEASKILEALGIGTS
jgi:AraC family transcriptional regulator